MIITTSRKPSRKTRRLARVLANFMNWEYITRGKLSFEELYLTLKKGENLAVIEEIKGNPAILKIISPEKGIIMLIKFSIGEIRKIKMDKSPVVFVGKPPFDPLIFESFPLSKTASKLINKVEFKKKIYVKRKNEILVFEFKYDKELITRLKIHDSRIYI